MLDWAGRGTRLPPGFATARIETNRVGCWSLEPLPHTAQATEECCVANPVHLLCRALRMAPASYHRFELAAAQQSRPLEIAGGGYVDVGEHETCLSPSSNTATFDSIAGLAAAMRRFEAAEGLMVHVSPDEQTIFVRRVAAETFVDGLSVGSGHVQ